MKAAVFHGPNDIRIEDVPEPKIDDDEVLVRVSACGFCGSDLDYYSGRTPLLTPSGTGPLVLGHELAGRVVACGRLAVAHGLAEGDRVAVNPVQSCNSCDACNAGAPHFCGYVTTLGVSTDGGLAEYAKTKYWHAYPLPDSLSDEQGAFVEMLASAVNAVLKAEIAFQNFVVISGPGPVGLAMVQLAKQQGARVAIVGTRDYRLALAEELGADAVFNIVDLESPYFVRDLDFAVREANNGKLADRVVVATGSIEAHKAALAISGRGSIIVFMGLPGPRDALEVPLLASLYDDKTIRFSWQYPHKWPLTIDILSNERVDTARLITHSVPLEDVAGAIDRLRGREDAVVKTVVIP